MTDSEYGVLDYPERVASGGYQLLRENFRTLVVLGVIVYLAIMAGIVDAPNVGLELPLWVRVLGVFGALAAVGGHWVGSKILSQVEPDWNYLAYTRIDDDGETRVRVDKLTDAVLEDITVHGGHLGRDPVRRNWFYAREFNGDAENPEAYATWNNVASDTELLATDPEDLEEEVRDTRESYERTIYKADRLTTHLPMVVRRLHAAKAGDLNAALEGHLAPDMGSGTIDTVIDEVIPDDLQPDRFERRLDSMRDEETPTIRKATEDVEEIDPSPDATDDGAAVATDGGESDE